MDLRKIFAQRHPIYQRHAPYWKFYHDHYEGGARYLSKPNQLPLDVQAGGSQQTTPGRFYGTRYYLWQHPLEQADRYLHRLRRACYINIVAPVVDFYCSTVGKQSNVLIDMGSDERMQALRDDFDLQGSSYHTFMAKARINATVRGLTFLLVDCTQATGEVRTEADVQAQGIRPYITEILPEKLLNWRLDKFGRCIEALFEVETEVPGSLLQESDRQECGKEYRYWNQSEWRVYQQQGEAIIQADEGTHQLGFVPIVPLYHKKKENFLGDSLVKDAAKIGQLVTNWVSSFDESLENQMFAILTVTTNDTLAEVGVGISTIFKLKPKDGDQGEEKLEFVAPPTDAFDASWNAFYRMVELANKHMGMAPSAVGESPSPQSGVSKAWDFFEADKIMSEMATNEQEAAKCVLDFAAKWLNGPQAEFDGSVQYATQYDMTTLADDIQNALSLQVAGAPIAMRKELMRRLKAKALPSLPRSVSDEIDSQIEQMGGVPGQVIQPPAVMITDRVASA